MATQSIPAPISLTASGGRGEIYAHGAHLTSWVPDGNAPVVWMSDHARFEPDVAIRGGIPIIFPWFGAGRSGEMEPAHGFARTSIWKLVDQGSDGTDAVALFALQGSLHGDQNSPGAFYARYEVRLGGALQLSLTIENSGENAFSYEAALHSYFRVGDVRRIHLEGLDGSSYLDQADPSGPVIRKQEGDVEFTGETDRIYRSSSAVRIVDPVLGRVLLIEKEHSASTVVWNPWTEKARRMSDFGDDEWSSMVCVEGGNLRAAAVHLGPAESHEMRYCVHMEELNQRQRLQAAPKSPS